MSLQSECRTRVTVHSVQLLPDKAFREQEVFETLSLDPDAKANMVIPVVVSILIDNIVWLFQFCKKKFTLLVDFPSMKGKKSVRGALFHPILY